MDSAPLVAPWEASVVPELLESSSWVVVACPSDAVVDVETLAEAVEDELEPASELLVVAVPLTSDVVAPFSSVVAAPLLAVAVEALF